MTTEQAVKAIQSHLAEHIEEVPERLLENIKDIINTTRLIIKKEVICENFKTEKPNLKKEWAEICKLYDLDPLKAKKGRQAKKISAKAHFVRKIILTYKYVTLIDLKNFLGFGDHSSIINLRDWSKAECPIPPFYGKRRYIIDAPENHG
jgi:hypothetical protein